MSYFHPCEVNIRFSNEASTALTCDWFLFLSLKLVPFPLNNWLVQVHCQIVQLVLRNNALTSLHGIENLKSLQGLDLSYNILSNFSEIEILAGFPSLQNLWLEGNPLCCARWFRAKVFSLFSHPDLVSRCLSSLRL